jgi:tetratricopeptide (TPR) repeat protein
MIQCSECKTMNSPELSVCTKCSADLLPGATRTQKLGAIGGAVFFLILGAGLLIAAVSLFRQLGSGQEDFGRPNGVIVLMLLVVAVGCFYFAFNRFKFSTATSSIDEKYYYRAKRHVGIDNDQAEADFTESIRLAPSLGSIGLLSNPKSFVYRHERAIFYEKTGKLELAISDYGKLISVFSDDPLCRYERGLIHEKLGHTNEARLDFEHTLEIMSKNSDTWKGAKPVGIAEVKAALKRVSAR